ncbi:MAG: chitobiase/beta-hexosaminidase C-terminal domain-containing protein, partial [Erysipelotrichaceae bacterium]|nr:chitobiase/beta-hexosaminidase C-terminal domain-containing protein [Erysipelotrichaceae bacterium]
TLTFHANREGATLDGGLKEIKVKVAKGTAFRYSKNNTYSDELFSAPSLNASGVTDNVVPLERINSNGSKTVGWATNEAGTGSIYMFSSYSHAVIEQDGTSRGLGMYGFVPTSDMDFYVKWDEPVSLIFTSNKLKFREGSRYDIYGELSEDRTERALKVPKGITFASVTTPSPNIFDTSEYAYFSYRWSLDKDGKNSITNDTKVTDGIKVYLYVYNESQTSSTAERMIFYSGDGYFDSPTIKEYTFNYDKTARTLSPTIPSINDSTKAFDGWYLDAECKNRYDDKYQFYSGGTWRVVPTKGVTELYAGYSSTYSVTLDANGGYFDDSSSRTKNPDEVLRDRTRFVVKASPAKQGIRISDYTQRIRRDGNKIFTGWYYEDGKRAALSSDGINQEFFKSDKGNCTLYAGWEDYVPVTSVSVANREQTISIGESVLLKATVEPDSAKNEDIHWNISSYQCDDDNTYYKVPVSITSEGLVTGMATGTAGVYAVVNGVMSELVTITVTSKPVQNSISIPEEFKNLNLINGDRIVVKADVTPASKAVEVKWTTGNSAIANVEANGDTATITAGDTEGTTTITASLGSLKATLSVTVSVPIKLDKNELTLTAGGDSNTLEAIVSNPELSKKQVIWTITNDSIASVKADPSDSKKAVVVPADTLNESATAVIKATLDGTEYNAECTVTVNAMLKAEKPEADVPAGNVKKGTVVKVKSATAGAVVFYTTDGSEPQVDTSGIPSGTTSKLQDTLTIDEDMTIKAVAFKSGFVVSETAVFEYKVDNQNWGQIGKLSDEDPLKELIEKHFENDSSKVPAGVWYIFRNGDDYKIVTEAGGDTGISRPYCNDKITFNDDIIILNGTGFLIENRDYTLTYANNTLANVAQMKVPQVTIKGKGIYNSSV